MAKYKYHCPNCGSPVLAERWRLGYEYCMDQRCFRALGKKVPIHEKLPSPDEVDIKPYELDDIAQAWDNG